MASYTRQLLSGTPADGRPIPVVATGVGGTPVHVCATGNALDEIHLWASNVTGTAALLTVEFGAQVNPGDHLVDQYAIPPHSAPIPIATGQTLTNGAAVTAYADTANAINLTGYVNRIA